MSNLKLWLKLDNVTRYIDSVVYKRFNLFKRVCSPQPVPKVLLVFWTPRFSLWASEDPGAGVFVSAKPLTGSLRVVFGWWYLVLILKTLCVDIVTEALPPSKTYKEGDNVNDTAKIC